jgi:putative protease
MSGYLSGLSSPSVTEKSLAEGIRYAHQKGRKVLAAINTYAQAGRFADWTASVDKAAMLGIDAVIIADPAVLDYAAQTHPQMRRHLSVQASATSYEAINFCREIGIAHV